MPVGKKVEKPRSKKIVSLFSMIKRIQNQEIDVTYEECMKELLVNPPPVKLFCSWFEQLIHCVPIINKDANKLIKDLMAIPWEYGEEQVVTLYRDFILSLVTSQNYFLQIILERLFHRLLPVTKSDAIVTHPFKLGEAEIIAYQNVVQLIVDIAFHVPMCHTVLVMVAGKACPYITSDTRKHSVFTFNMLLLGEKLPKIKKELLEIIIMNIMKLDLHTPREELLNELASDEEDDGVFDMELDSEEILEAKEKEKKESRVQMTAHTLDMLMVLMFRYIHLIIHGGTQESSLVCLLSTEDDFVVRGCRAGSVSFGGRGDDDRKKTLNQLSCGCECGRTKHDIGRAKELYITLKDLFSKLLLPTQKCSFVQYLLFYLISIRPILLSDFVDFLRSTFENFSQSRDQRRNVLAYLSSILSRGNFVSFTHIHSCNELLRDWCFAYLQRNQNEGEDLQRHSTFYFVCQAIFYIFTFNYKKYTESKKRIKLARSLNLNILVLSSLNPLRYCTQTVTDNFSAIAHHYQIAYCQTVIENNRRVVLPVATQTSSGNYIVTATDVEMVFPFDRYILQKSECFVENFYVEFPGLPEDMNSNLKKTAIKEFESMEDDESEPNPLFCVSPQQMSFSLEMSPPVIRR